MAINFNAEPYYDDFNETKEFYRILFKPGYAVQARELTQLQTQLQDQIKKLGTNIFKDGTVVIGGEMSFDSTLIALRINTAYNNITLTVTALNALVGKTVTGSNSKVEGFVKQVVFGTEYHLLIIKVTSGANFSASEIITIPSTSNPLVGVNTATVTTVTPFNTCTLFSVKSGIFFINGAFVWTPDQSILVDQLITVAAGNFVIGSLYRISNVGNTDFTLLGAQTNTVGTYFVATGTGTLGQTGTVLNVSSKNIGFIVNELTVSSEEDETLLDNAQGSFNYAAPGADRYKIDLQLAIKNLDGSLDNFIELARVDNDQYVVTAPNTVYNTLGKELARRTYDESGNYTVSNFPLILKDNINGDANKFTAALDPGKAYVAGYEFETKNQSYLNLNRARTFEVETNPAISSFYGNYIDVTNLSGEFVTTVSVGTNSYSTVQLHNVAKATTMTSATLIGTAQVRYLKYDTGIGATSTWVYKMYLFNIVIAPNKAFKDVESIVILSGTTLQAGANIALSSKAGGVAGVTGDSTTDVGAAFVSGADRVGLVFPLYREYVSTIRDAANSPKTGYTFQRTHQNVAFTSGSASFSTASSNERFVSGVGDLPDPDVRENYHVVVTSVGTSLFAVGDVLDFTATSRSIVLGSDTPGSAQSITFNANTATNFTATIIVTVININQTERTKQLSGYTFATLTPDSNPLRGDKYSLGKADGYDLLAVYNTKASNPTGQITVDALTGAVTGWGTVIANNRNINVTRDYIFDNGQRDEIYDYANIVATGELRAATDHLVVVFRHFTHSGGSGFLDVNSYLAAIPYTSIPTFTSPTTGITYNLRDCLDFRPRKNDTTSTQLDGGQIPDPSGIINATFQYYVGRKDIILAMPSKQFAVKTGTPSLSPQTPSLNSDGMPLYILSIPPYTADLDEISVEYIDNRRYTMKDIGKIEKRVGNIEYYTQLSLLEKQAKDDSITDVDTREKFKNGIIVDPFAGHNIGDANNPDYRCAIDIQRQELRAFAETYNTEFTYNKASASSTKRVGDLVTLTYTETPFVVQPFATGAMNINPFNIIAFVGSISLEPSQDLWVDTVTAPPLNITQDVSQTVNVFKPIQYRNIYNYWWWGSYWGWNYGWGWGGWGYGWHGGWNGYGWGGWWGGWRRSYSSSETTTTSSVAVTSETESLGTNVIDLQFLPFIRARSVFGKGTGLKPNTRHYPYMDETSLETGTLATSYVRPLLQVVINEITGNLFDDSVGVYEKVTFRTVSTTGTIVATANTAMLTPVTRATGSSATSDKRRILYVYNSVGTIAIGHFVVGENGGSAKVVSVGYTGVVTGNLATIPTGVPPALGTAMYTDEFGMIGFEYQIPGGKFRCGERKVRFIDNPDNNTSTSQSSADTTYFALGQLKTERETLLTTRTTTTTITSQQTVTQVCGWGDPLAESFLVDSLAYPNGLHLTSIDLYFRTRSAGNVPVTVQLRKMVNGYPESTSSITFGETTLFPEDIPISEDASAKTTFTFPSSVYLAADEYCFVVMSNSNEYEVFISEMGATMVGTNTRVTQQPYAGSLFKSQNGTTWTAEQLSDIKFNLNRAKFAYSGTADFTCYDPPSYVPTAGTLTNTSANITNLPLATFNNIGLGMVVYAPGYVAPGTTIIGIIYANSIPNGIPNGVIMSSPALQGGTHTSAAPLFTFYGQPEFGTLNLNSSIIAPSSTNVSLFAKTTDKGTGNYDSVGVPIVNKTDYEFNSVKKVIPAANNGGIPSLQISATLTTTNDSVSPAVDVGRLSSVMVKNVINNPTPVLENVKAGGNAWCKYITKKVTLAFDASNLVVTFSAYKPYNTDVKVYYKILPVEKTTPIDDESWVEMNIETPIGFSTSTSDYKEHRYFPSGAFLAYGVPKDNPISPRFNNFQIKIVLLSSSEAISPRIRDFRGIALDS
jgi:hypothetical protein